MAEDQKIAQVIAEDTNLQFYRHLRHEKSIEFRASLNELRQETKSLQDFIYFSLNL
jgi:hypothetical protein